MSDQAKPKTLNDLGLDMFHPEVIANPHPFYATLRRQAPIIWSEQTQSWVLSRYEDVRAVLRNDAQFSSARGGEAPVLSGRSDIPLERVAPAGTLTMLDADRPDHTRLRKLLAKDFTPAKLRDLKPHIQALCRDLLSEVDLSTPFEVVRGLAEPLPVTIIAELLGIPPQMWTQFKTWSDAATEPVPPDASDAAVLQRNRLIVEFREYLQSCIDERQAQPTDDFIGRLVAAHDDEAQLSDNEVLAGVNLLLLAGNETTTNLISNAVLALAKFPQQQAQLRDNPELIEPAVEEFLRYDGSVQFTVRDLLAPATFHGQEIARGERVIILLASANRDAAVFDHADELDFHRPKDKHLGFGDWIHICLGQFLARMETTAALHTLLEKLPPFELAVPEREIPYRPNFNLRGPSALPIRAIAG
jgi:cytochrome P450